LPIDLLEINHKQTRYKITKKRGGSPLILTTGRCAGEEVEGP